MPTITSIIDDKKRAAWGESGFPSKFLVLQRRIAKYVLLPFVFSCLRAIAVGSSHHVVRFELFAKIAPLEKPSLKY